MTKTIKSSLDKNQPIYISEKDRVRLFNRILLEEENYKNVDNLYKYMFSAENLERYCLGATSRGDYAYNKISKLLRNEYEEWKVKKILSTEGGKYENGNL